MSDKHKKKFSSESESSDAGTTKAQKTLANETPIVSATFTDGITVYAADEPSLDQCHAYPEWFQCGDENISKKECVKLDCCYVEPALFELHCFKKPETPSRKFGRPKYIF